jgi:flagellar motor switch/type III secretory pathway protein FliN
MSALPRTGEPDVAPISMAAMHPFPWKTLETITRAEVAALREMRRRVARNVRLDALAAALAGLIGADVKVLVGRVTSLRAGAVGRALDGGIGVVLAPADGDALAGAALLEVEPALAAVVVARVLRRPPPVVVNAAAAPSEAIAGALAAVIVAAARRAHAHAMPLRAVSAGAAPVLEADFVRGDSQTLSLSLTVLVGDDAYASRLVVRRVEALSMPRREWTARSLSSLGELPLSLPIVGCATRARVADVASLRVGDAWLPGTWPLEVVSDGGANGAAGSLRGPVLLAAPSAAAGVRARLVDGGRLVLSGEVDAVCAAEADMTEAEAESALLDALGDVPVVVRVEIGEARMAARDWAALGRGDVITVGRRVGELVVLRVGGVAVARGELVNVDGEVGVRIAERIAANVTDATGATSA